MARHKTEPSADGMWRTSIALRARPWGDRLLAILDRKQITFPEQVRRWITTEEWLDAHSGPDSVQPLFLRLPDGSYERVRLIK